MFKVKDQLIGKLYSEIGMHLIKMEVKKDIVFEKNDILITEMEARTGELTYFSDLSQQNKKKSVSRAFNLLYKCHCILFTVIIVQDSRTQLVTVVAVLLLC